MPFATLPVSAVRPQPVIHRGWTAPRLALIADAAHVVTEFGGSSPAVTGGMLS